MGEGGREKAEYIEPEGLEQASGEARRAVKEEWWVGEWVG
jgi:hypothetical protein